jgi:type IV pilus assembly protein PilW
MAVKIVSLVGAEAGVDNNLGCNNGDTVMVSAGTACAMTRVDDADLAADTTHITLASGAGASVNASLACMGNWSQFEYSVVNNQLQRHDASSINAAPIVSDVVNIQAQYGISAVANSNQITSWVDAGAPWNAPTVANRNRIKAVRVAVVARNGLQEKDNVTNTCTTSKGTVNNGPCAWDDTNVSAAPKIDLSKNSDGTNNPDWQRYRYRVYETIIPLRNMIWSKNIL